MSSGLHLTHNISWNDLREYFTAYRDPGIELPVGKCGKIHTTSRKCQLQVQNRPYLSNQVCTDEHCREENDSKVFRKNNKSKLTLNGGNCRAEQKSNSYNHFIGSFSSAIREFARTERNKVAKRKIVTAKNHHEDVIEKIEKEKQCKIDYMMCCPSGLCSVFSILIEAGDCATLLSFTNDEIRSVLSCQHGGQAVGNNIRFLWWHVLRVYVYTNMIVGCGLQDKPDEWGTMNPDDLFRQSLMQDCDGQTFLYSSRDFLASEVYMKDWQATKQLCKNCFQFLYFVEMLRQEVNPDRTEDDLKGDIDLF